MKKRFALCFRPIGIETEEVDHKRHHHHDLDVAVSSSIVVSKEQKNSKMPAGIFGSASPKISCHPRPLRTGSRKALSRVLKSISFETAPGVRVGDHGKIRQITFVQSNESSNMVDDKPSKMKKRDSINIQQVSSSSFSSTTSSTSSSASVSPSCPSSELNNDTESVKKRAFARSRSNSFHQKKKPKTTKTCSIKEDLVLYLIIILALFATIVWGKILAVLFTSLCLYIIPMGLNGYYRESANGMKLPEMETSKEQKKRVIMEGLLERKPIQRALNL